MSRRPKIAIFLCSLILSGCDADSVRQPPAAERSLPLQSEVELIERELNGRPCINDIRAWKRKYFYSYSKKNQTLDNSILQFDLEMSAGSQIEPGVVLLPPGGLRNLDDRDIIVASGQFDKPTGVVKLKYCGRNLP